MCFAIERRIEAPGLGGANYENNVIVTEAGPEVVTLAPDRYGERRDGPSDPPDRA